MLRAALISGAILIVMLSGVMHAASVMTKNGPVHGKILAENTDTVTVGAESGSTQTIKRLDILIIYDDAGQALWQNPDIVASDAPKETTTAVAEIGVKRTFSAELHSGFGISSPSSVFSSFHVGSGPDYHFQYEVEAAGVYSFTQSDALVATLGYAKRNLTAAGITLDGIRGNTTWPMQFLDARLGYRLSSGLGFAEFGFLYATHLGNAQAEHVTTVSTYTPATPLIAQKSYGAFYLAAGISLPIDEKLSFLSFVRLDHGLGSAVRGDVPTQLSETGQTVSSATLSLVPWSVALHLGVGYRL